MTATKRPGGHDVSDPDAWVPLAEIARAHGIKGEVRLRLFNKSSDALLGQDEVLVRLPDGEEHEVSVDAARRADDAVLMKLFSVDDRDRADELRGSLVCIRRRDFPPLEDDEFYNIDVVGSDVMLGETVVGTVTEIAEYPSIDVLVVTGPSGLLEIPLTDHFVGSVDVAARRVELRTLEGVEPAPVRAPRAEG